MSAKRPASSIPDRVRGPAALLRGALGEQAYGVDLLAGMCLISCHKAGGSGVEHRSDYGLQELRVAR